MQHKILAISFMTVLSLVMWIFSHGVAQADDKSAAGASPQESEIFTGETGKPNETKFLPEGNLFRPLVADPKELRFYLSYRPYQHAPYYISQSTEIFAGSLGDIFGLYRSINNSGGYSWQASISGGIYSEFDIKYFYLVDSDFFIGFPFTFRKGPVSYRLNVYHQSSHVGDQYLQHSSITRIEFSYEAINFIGSYEWTMWRIYYGGEYMVQVEPSSYRPITIQSGLEYYGTHRFLLGGRVVGGLDLKCTQENGWPLNTSFKAGLQFDDSNPKGRSIRFLHEGYKGLSPVGQFFNDRLTKVGLGLTFEFQ